MKAFAEKYEQFYTTFNHGKSGPQRKRNKRLGKKAMRNKLKYMFPGGNSREDKERKIC